jgi:tRNA(Ile)-lysidine synthase
MAWHYINHFLYKKYQSALRGKSLLLCLSGGLDSTVLAHAFCELRKPLSLKLVAIHFHHGSKKNLESCGEFDQGGELEQSRFRDEAGLKVIHLAESLDLPLKVVRAKTFLRTEQEGRHFRRRGSLEFLGRAGLDFVVQAHHRDDLLETRLFRLFRGTGLQGLQAMSEFSNDKKIFRPFLSFSRKDILEYAKWHQLSWVEDPSNLNVNFRRNWIRQKLLPALERKFPESSRHLHHFLEEVLQAQPELDFSSLILSSGDKFNRKAFAQLSASEQSKLISRICAGEKSLAFSRKQVDQIRQRLLSTRKDQDFIVAKRHWQTDEFSFWMMPHQKGQS